MADPINRKLAAILSADVVGYSRLMAADEDDTIRRITALRERIATTVERHRGRVVDSPGDNVLAEFPSALESVRAALEIQAALRERNADRPADKRMELRVGVHLGDVATDGERVYGDGVNIAARLEGLADPGGICISATVHEQVRNKLEARFHDLGDRTVKNIPDQVHVYSVEQARPGEARPARAPARAPGRRRGIRRAAIGFAAVLAVLAVALWATWPRPLGWLIDASGLDASPGQPALPEKPSIVVLPFANLSDRPDQAYFSDGITEELINELARDPYIFVIARNSAFTYKGRPVNVEQVGRELGVRYVLEGGVRRSDDRVRITARLIDARNGGHLWSERYDRDLSDIFAVQAQIAEEVVAVVSGEILRAEEQRLKRRPTTSLGAYDAYLKGSVQFLSSTLRGNENARELFARAIALDPDFAPAHAALGVTYVVEYANGWSRDPALLERADALASRAITLDAGHFQGYAVRGWVAFLQERLDEAIAAADQAIELAPNFEVPHALRGMALAQQGRFIQATRSVRRALRLSPRARIPGVVIGLAFVNAAAGRRDEAVAAMEQARALAPESLPVRVGLAAFYGTAGETGKARAEVQEVLRIRPDLTAEAAIELIPGLDRLLGPQDLAELPQRLRQAGLP